MNYLLLASLAIGPGAILLHRAYVRDRHREPPNNVLVYVLLGALVTVPVAWMEGVIFPFFQISNRHVEPSALKLGLLALFGVALVEELGKRLALQLRAGSDRHIDEPFDWIVYSVAVSLGFATVENVLYVFQYGVGTGVARAFTAVPCHALCGTMMGWHLSRARRCTGAPARKHQILALVEPMLWHGAYDGLLFWAHSSHAVPSDVVRWLLPKALLALIVLQILVAMMRVDVAANEVGAPSPPLLAVQAALRRRRAKRRT